MKFSSTCLCLCGISAALALENPATTPRKTTASRVSPGDSVRSAAAETAAAIEALGAQPSTRQISSIVFKAVRTSPADVLPIVDAAVRVSPQSAAPEIVTAATAAVPDPWKKVTYRRIERDAKKGARDFKSGPDGRRTVNLDGRPTDPGTGHGSNRGLSGTGSGSGNARSGDPAAGSTAAAGASTAGNILTLSLAEAIARTAFDAQPGLSFPALQSAADIALNSDPATLLRNIQSPRAISGVGDAGSSNFANEPLRARVAGSAAVPAPNPPVVSR